MVSSKFIEHRGNIAAEVEDLPDIESWLAPFNRARLDDSNSDRMRRFGEEVKK
jgi:hypothetical protein